MMEGGLYRSVQYRYSTIRTVVVFWCTGREVDCWLDGWMRLDGLEMQLAVGGWRMANLGIHLV
jgi:hypothetical protein